MSDARDHLAEMNAACRTALDADRDRWAALTWLTRQQHLIAVQIYTHLAGAPEHRRWRGTALDAIAAAGQPCWGGQPA